MLEGKKGRERESESESERTREKERERVRKGERERARETRIKSGAFVDWISAWCMPLHALSMLYKCLNVYR